MCGQKCSIMDELIIQVHRIWTAKMSTGLYLQLGPSPLVTIINETSFLHYFARHKSSLIFMIQYPSGIRVHPGAFHLRWERERFLDPSNVCSPVGLRLDVLSLDLTEAAPHVCWQEPRSFPSAGATLAEICRGARWVLMSL